MDLYWKYEVWARKRHSEIDSLFNATGCIYAMRRSLARPLPADTLVDDAILPLRAFFEGYRVILDPEAIAYDYPAVAGTEFRRRLRTLAGLWQVYARLPELFTSRDRMRYHFISHKFGRLMLPWAVSVFLVSTISLGPSRLRFFLVLAEAVCLLPAVCDWFVSSDSPLKRFTSPAKTLLVMNVASMASVAVFFVPASRLWTKTLMQAASGHAGATRD
jgi:biofilm PGA synthesis N-glycosyltransferase PgaC